MFSSIVRENRIHIYSGWPLLVRRSCSCQPGWPPLLASAPLSLAYSLNKVFRENPRSSPPSFILPPTTDSKMSLDASMFHSHYVGMESSPGMENEPFLWKEVRHFDLKAGIDFSSASRAPWFQPRSLEKAVCSLLSQENHASRGLQSSGELKSPKESTARNRFAKEIYPQ